jgi:hypothetical protein
MKNKTNLAIVNSGGRTRLVIAKKVPHWPYNKEIVEHALSNKELLRLAKALLAYAKV